MLGIFFLGIFFMQKWVKSENKLKKTFIEFFFKEKYRLNLI